MLVDRPCCLCRCRAVPIAAAPCDVVPECQKRCSAAMSRQLSTWRIAVVISHAAPTTATVPAAVHPAPTATVRIFVFTVSLLADRPIADWVAAWWASPAGR